LLKQRQSAVLGIEHGSVTENSKDPRYVVRKMGLSLKRGLRLYAIRPSRFTRIVKLKTWKEGGETSPLDK